MLTLGSKTSTGSQIYLFLVIFEITAGTLRQGHLLDLHDIDFAKKDQITISVPISLNKNQ